MTAKDLKNALLQEAVQGKLVPQIASEGNAKDLLEEIKKEKDKLIKEGKLKKEKPLPEITEDEIPFDIPENWCWCRLGNIAEIQSSKRVFEKDYVSSGIPFFRSKEIGDLSRGEEIHTQLFITRNHYEELKTKYGVPQAGDILLTSVGSIGNLWICDGREFYYKDGNVTQICKSDFLDSKYITTFLNSPFFYEQVNSTVSGTAYNALTIIKLKSLIFPLPPLAEQKRIVAAIEHFMPLIEEYGKKEAELTALNADIAKTLKNAILQEAVQGKLAPQIASEGNAKDLLEEIKKEKAKLIKEGKLKKEKTLPEITEEEIPFDIPENWCWCRLGDLVQVISGISYDKKDVSKDGYRILRGGNIQNSKIIIEDDDVFLPELYLDEPKLVRKGDIVIVASTGSKAVIGKSGFVEQDIPNTMIGAFLRICRPYSLDTIGYLRYLFESDFYRKHIRDLSQGTNINNVKESYITEFVIPLPPLGEQKRIVTVIEQFKQFCINIGENNEEIK